MANPMTGEIWQVQIVFPDMDDNAVESGAPVKFGTPQIYAMPVDNPIPVDPSIPEGPHVPMIYGPVGLHQSGGTLYIFSTGEPVDEGNGRHRIPRRNWRDMEILRVQFFDWGHIEVEGFERRKDGTMVYARWLVEPCYDEEEEGPGE